MSRSASNSHSMLKGDSGFQPSLISPFNLSYESLPDNSRNKKWWFLLWNDFLLSSVLTSIPGSENLSMSFLSNENCNDFPSVFLFESKLSEFS